MHMGEATKAMRAGGLTVPVVKDGEGRYSVLCMYDVNGSSLA